MDPSSVFIGGKELTEHLATAVIFTFHLLRMGFFSSSGELCFPQTYFNFFVYTASLFLSHTHQHSFVFITKAQISVRAHWEFNDPACINQSNQYTI